ncbi:putative trehalase N2227-like protein [Metschnikowia bicuspidata var. bicuspidata NRRL YB-4993]|uniref:Putative trehalase N2227-like protein n=1 Tax=Metschnikowia bicuspidata var. bicuspidata NRRL YB-4993 TaxID=869754 RepID=A0A1A0HAH4_9ASCO|nr:putative trehalase N2227-like protein [Metschnikowia bicuspidata var. bicuspidata NRRL YB-4993]OBA20877.1 putative trehalase N2227-like protein [Metschnikowia bicuspidata var. bicuspidata NRRL YB-4993]
MLSRTATVQGLARWAVLLAASQTRHFGLFRAPTPAPGAENSRFSALAPLSQTELVEALVSLREYGKNSRQASVRRRRLYKMMSWRQQRLCDEAGYLEKLRQIDVHIDRNQAFFSAIVTATENAYGLGHEHYDAWRSRGRTASQNTSSSNYRVVEALGHFVRDWASSGEEETAPMLQYIKRQLEAAIRPEDAARTCVVVPGSGLGRVAHEVARHRDYGAVHAVEFSGLMHACHRSIYEPSLATEHRLFPHIHSTSNSVNPQAHLRACEVPAGVARPPNLHLHLEDFRHFAVPGREEYDHVVVVSAFFIDTAENILDFFDQILQLAAPAKTTGPRNGFWINYGPLKYGSAAQAELSAAEIAHVRQNMGWVDRHYLNTVEDPAAEFAASSLAGSGLAGYITDKQSMWQGYYGISMWTSGHKANRDGPAGKDGLKAAKRE